LHKATAIAPDFRGRFIEKGLHQVHTLIRSPAGSPNQINYNPSRMEPSRISTLLTPFIPHPLSEPQLQQVSVYLDLLLRWNQRMNLTAVRDEENIVTRHFGESLFAASRLFPLDAPDPASHVASPAPSVVDLGSGAGFPGLPLKIWAPHIHLTLIESNHKKVAFLREAARAITLTNIDVFAGRAEDFPSTADIVTLRAVEHFDSILPIAIGLLSPTGLLALLIGSSQLSRAQAHPLQWQTPVPLPGSTARYLLTGKLLTEPNS
jgi:16S rRNA (guanine527-N7)-methyltransferase